MILETRLPHKLSTSCGTGNLIELSIQKFWVPNKDKGTLGSVLGSPYFDPYGTLNRKLLMYLRRTQTSSWEPILGSKMLKGLGGKGLGLKTTPNTVNRRGPYIISRILISGREKWELVSQAPQFYIFLALLENLQICYATMEEIYLLFVIFLHALCLHQIVGA